MEESKTLAAELNGKYAGKRFEAGEDGRVALLVAHEGCETRVHDLFHSEDWSHEAHPFDHYGVSEADARRLLASGQAAV
jgi:hypothetical protein